MTNRKDWKIAYLNPTLINQTAINPQINENDPAYMDKTSQELAEMKANMTNEARSRVATYIYDSFMKWQNRHSIMAPYNFK